METIPHRELRNSSSAILARVAAGDSFEVTNNGVVTAVLIPPGSSELSRARLAGAVREARTRAPRFDNIARRRSTVSTEAILDDLRGDR